ncbi:site-specific integrase [Streptomyces piniterrae]|uniref:site-specific integrase n=1 Tax=Streptomyces piniterrae TaxID=2571125 RepID=UPI001FE76570|nr:site-specific integrase [Streptomyces piniterrae]
MCIEEYPDPKRKSRRDCIGSWQARYRDPAGKQKARNFAKKAEAEDFLDEVRTSVRRRTYHDPKRGKIKLSTWWETWWEIRQQTGRVTTRNRILAVWRAHIKPKWGNFPLINLELMELQRWLTGEVKGYDTQKKCKEILRALLEAAVKDGKRIPENPAAGLVITATRNEKHPDDLKPPTAAQYAMIHAALDPYYQVIFRDFADETGMRPGEYAGLRLHCVDEEEMVVHIKEIIVNDGGRLRRQAAPKTKAGFRTVPLTPRAAGAIAFMKAKWKPARTRSAIGDGFDLHVEELIFRGPRGAALNINNLSRPWKAATVQAGVARKVVNPETGRTEWWPKINAYRHDVTTRLHRLGIPEKDAQAVLGQERGGRVTWVYTHESEGARERVRAALGGESGLRVVS